MGIDEISTETESSMITESIAMIVVECPHLPQGVGRTCLGSMMTDVLIVVGEGFQSTPKGQALTRDPSSCKVWSTGTELIEVAMTEMCPQAAESMFQVQNALA